MADLFSQQAKLTGATETETHLKYILVLVCILVVICAHGINLQPEQMYTADISRYLS